MAREVEIAVAAKARQEVEAVIANEPRHEVRLRGSLRSKRSPHNGA